VSKRFLAWHPPTVETHPGFTAESRLNSWRWSESLVRDSSGDVELLAVRARQTKLAQAIAVLCCSPVVALGDDQLSISRSRQNEPNSIVDEDCDETKDVQILGDDPSLGVDEFFLIDDEGAEPSTSEEFDSEVAAQPDRSKLLARAMAVLIAERQRSGEPLRQESIERVYVHLKLTPPEMLRVGHEARSIGLMDTGEPDELDELAIDVEDSEEIPDARNGLLDRILGHDLLGADRERQLGRAIQIAKSLRLQLASGQHPGSDELSRELVRGNQARQALVLANARLAMDIARRYMHVGLDLDDLLQEGVIGLMRAVESYDPDLGFRFTTYATWWIRQAILRAVANTGRSIRIPVHRVDQLKLLRRTVRRLQAKDMQRRVTPNQIADELGWSLELVGKLMVLDAETFTSIHPADEGGPSILDQLASSDPTPEAATIAFDFQAFIAGCVDALPAREAEILRLRFGLCGNRSHTLEEIGKQYDLTRERIRQIESKGMHKLRRPSGKLMEHGRDFLDE
jgi:RNA polymerase primary sigma factor